MSFLPRDRPALRGEARDSSGQLVPLVGAADGHLRGNVAADGALEPGEAVLDGAGAAGDADGGARPGDADEVGPRVAVDERHLRVGEVEVEAAEGGRDAREDARAGAFVGAGGLRGRPDAGLAEGLEAGARGTDAPAAAAAAAEAEPRGLGDGARLGAGGGGAVEAEVLEREREAGREAQLGGGEGVAGARGEPLEDEPADPGGADREVGADVEQREEEDERPEDFLGADVHGGGGRITARRAG